jgi:hypothetical protein
MMPQQTVFFNEQIGAKQIVINKSYDPSFAKEAFDQMNSSALHFLGSFLELDEELFPDDPVSEEDYADAIWQEVQDGAREEWNTFSYFVMTKEEAGRSEPLFVSADWPSAEAYAKHYIAS